MKDFTTPTFHSDESAMCRACAARPKCPCGASTEQAVERLGSGSRHITFATGDVILHRGNQGGKMLTLQHGTAAARTQAEDGREQMSWMYFEGDVIGHPRGNPAPHDVIALTEVTVCEVECTSYLDAIETDSGFRSSYINTMLRSFNEAQGWMLTLGRKTPTERVASFLHLLSTRSTRSMVNVNGTLVMSLPLSRGEIANFLGLRVETVSRGFTALRSEKIISVSGRSVEIHDTNRLQLATGNMR